MFINSNFVPSELANKQLYIFYSIISELEYKFGENIYWVLLTFHSFIHSLINGSTGLCWALASSSIS
jgi:hypothetical protein